MRMTQSNWKRMILPLMYLAFQEKIKLSFYFYQEATWFNHQNHLDGLTALIFTKERNHKR